jgi:hypothetical protein
MYVIRSSWGCIGVEYADTSAKFTSLDKLRRKECY